MAGNEATSSRLRIFVQGPGPKKTQVIEVSSASGVSDIIHEARKAGIDVGEDAIVMREDDDAPLDTGTTLEEAGLGNDASVHVGRCRRVEVKVRYGGDTKGEAFSPAQRLRHVFKWALSDRGFNIPDGDAQDLVLIVRGEQQPLDLDDHVGLFVMSDGCEVDLDLVARDRIQGWR